MVAELLPACPAVISSEEIKIVEYGCLSSTSACLVKPVIAQCADARTQAQTPDPLPRPSYTVIHSDGPASDFRPLMRQMDNLASDSSYPHSNSNVFPSFVARPYGSQVCPSGSVDIGFSLMDLHAKRTVPASIGSSRSAASIAAAATAAHMDMQAFLRARATEFKQGGLLLVAYIQRSEDTDSTIAFPATGTGHLGRAASLHETRYHHRPSLSSSPPSSGLSLSRSVGSSSASLPSMASTSSTVPSSASSFISSAETSMSPPTSAHISLPLSRCRSGSSPCSSSFGPEAVAKHQDIWSSIPALLAPCIQRLVSTGLIKSDTAHRLLAPPLHPRTPSQTIASLQAAKGQWKLERSCGLADSQSRLQPDGDFQASLATPTSATGDRSSQPKEDTPRHRVAPGKAEHALHLVHPAFTAYQASALSRIQFAEHALQFIRVLYEAHFRTILHDYAKLSRSRLEEVLDALTEVLREKIEEPGRPALPLELECCVFALRRV